MARPMTPGAVVRAALRDDLVPREAEALGRGWLAWDEGDLAYRAVVSRTGERMRWRVFVGDARLGPALKDYGSLSVALDPVDRDLRWPEGSRLSLEQATTLRMIFRDVRSVVRDRRQLAQLMTKTDDVRHGEVVAWLPAGGWPGRLAQALVIATDADDHALAATIRDLITVPGRRVVSRRPRHGADVTAAERDRLDARYLDQGDLEQDVRRESERWLGRYAAALGRAIPL